ncbi:hypothetical protein CLG85_021000, partial [Yangia mangrovi]|nr:hypothetical protein [Alloyangia mangrovi]
RPSRRHRRSDRWRIRWRPLTNRYLRSICQRVNATPRKCLGYRTPAEVFEAKLVDIQDRLI